MGVILAPLNGGGNARALLEAGARELYVGFYDPAWSALFGTASLNRMSGFGTEANSLNFEQLLEEAVRIGHLSRDCREMVSLYCVFNAMAYSSQQRIFIEQHYFPYLVPAGFTGVIVSDAELACAAHRCGLRVTASTMCAAYNSELVKYYVEQGCDRIILPRDLSLDEIAGIVQEVPRAHYEVFLMRNGCVFADSHCMGLHRAGQSSLCRSLRAASGWRQTSTYGVSSEEGAGPHGATHRLWAACFHVNTCGLCALWRFEQLGIDAYKIVGRGDDIESLTDDIALVRANLSIARGCTQESEYLARMERPQGMRELCAHKGLSCYYPEIRF